MVFWINFSNHKTCFSFSKEVYVYANRHAYSKLDFEWSQASTHSNAIFNLKLRWQSDIWKPLKSKWNTYYVPYVCIMCSTVCIYIIHHRSSVLNICVHCTFAHIHYILCIHGSNVELEFLKNFYICFLMFKN